MLMLRHPPPHGMPATCDPLNFWLWRVWMFMGATKPCHFIETGVRDSVLTDLKQALKKFRKKSYPYARNYLILIHTNPYVHDFLCRNRVIFASRCPQ